MSSSVGAVAGWKGSPDGRVGGRVPPGPVVRRRISAPWTLFGAVVILAGAVIGAVVADRVDTRVPVLAAARAVNAGQTLTTADVAVVRVAAEAGVATVPASQLSSVVGRTAAVPLVAGSLLAPDELGAAAWPPSGQAVIAVPVKAGHAPSGLGAGTQVLVLVVPAGPAGAGAAPSAGSGQGQVVQALATVVSIEQAADQSGTTVASLLLTTPNATRVVSAGGEVWLVQVGGNG